MNKEQDITQRLEELRVEQLKALRELKKLEKAKRKQRRRTAQGYPVSATDGTSENNTSDKIVATPAQDVRHARESASYSCGRIDGTRTKAKYTAREQNIASVSNANKYSSSCASAAQAKKKKKEHSDAHKKEIVSPKEVLISRSSVVCERDGAINNENVFKPAKSSDWTPNTCSFPNKERSDPYKIEKPVVSQKEVSAARSCGVSKSNGFEQIVFKPVEPVTGRIAEKVKNTATLVPGHENKSALRKSLTLAREAHGSKFPTPSSSRRKSQILKKDCVVEEQECLGNIKEANDVTTDLENISASHGNSAQSKGGKNSYDTKHTECNRTNSVSKHTVTNRPQSQTKHNKSESGEQEISEKTSKHEATISTSDQNFIDNFSRNIFSQSLFDNFVENDEDFSDVCEPVTLDRNVLVNNSEHKNATINELTANASSCDEPVTNRTGNHWVPGSSDRLDIMDKGEKKELVCKIDVVNSKENVPDNKTNLRSISSKEMRDLVLSGVSVNSTLHRNGEISVQNNGGTTNSNNLTGVAGNEVLSSKLRDVREVGDKVQHEKSPTVVMEDLLTSKATTDMISTSLTASLAKVVQAKVFSNQSSQLDEWSPDVKKLLLSQPSLPPSQNVPCKGHSNLEDNPIVREICLQHSLKIPESCNEVREVKFLTHQVGATRLHLIAVCFSRLLVLWKAIDNCTSWVVVNKWVLEKNYTICDMGVASVGSCVVLVTGGNFYKALGRVHCLQKNGCVELTFADLEETACSYKKMCLLPNKKEPAESISVVLVCGFKGKIALTKWTIDIMILCLEGYTNFPEISGSEVSSLCLVEGSCCLLLGCVDYVMHLWNYNSCEPLCKIPLQLSLLAQPVCLSAETNSGIIFVSLLYKEEKKVDLVAVNPQSCRKACLKTFDLVNAIDKQSNKLLHCSTTGAYVVSSYKHGKILMWNISTDNKTVLDPMFGDVSCISFHPKDSVIAFGTISGCVYLNSL